MNKFSRLALAAMIAVAALGSVSAEARYVHPIAVRPQPVLHGGPVPVRGPIGAPVRAGQLN